MWIVDVDPETRYIVEVYQRDVRSAVEREVSP